MLSRALITATVMLLTGCFTAIPVRAENLEAGKSPSQIFAGACSACHKGTRGLLRTVSPGSLPGFLRQHYTTSGDMAGLLSAYILANGAADTRMGGGLTKQGKDQKSEPKPAMAPDQAEPRLGRRQRPAAPQEASRPDADGLTAQGEPKGAEPATRLERNKRFARPSPENPAVEGQPAAAAAGDTGPGGHPRQKLSKRGRPGREEPPNAETGKTEPGTSESGKTDAGKTDPAKQAPSIGEAAKSEMSKDSPKDEGAKSTAAKGADEGKAEAAKVDGTRTEGAKPEGGKAEANRDETPLRADPVPPVTPAPKPSDGETKPVQTATPVSSPPAASAAASEPSAALPPAAKPAVEASVPPPAPVAPAGPPAPPISQ